MGAAGRVGGAAAARLHSTEHEGQDWVFDDVELDRAAKINTRAYHGMVGRT